MPLYIPVIGKAWDYVTQQLQIGNAAFENEAHQLDQYAKAEDDPLKKLGLRCLAGVYGASVSVVKLPSSLIHGSIEFVAMLPVAPTETVQSVYAAVIHNGDNMIDGGNAIADANWGIGSLHFLDGFLGDTAFVVGTRGLMKMGEVPMSRVKAQTQRLWYEHHQLPRIIRAGDFAALENTLLKWPDLSSQVIWELSVEAAKNPAALSCLQKFSQIQANLIAPVVTGLAEAMANIRYTPVKEALWSVLSQFEWRGISTQPQVMLARGQIEIPNLLERLRPKHIRYCFHEPETIPWGGQDPFSYTLDVSSLTSYARHPELAPWVIRGLRMVDLANDPFFGRLRELAHHNPHLRPLIVEALREIEPTHYRGIKDVQTAISYIQSLGDRPYTPPPRPPVPRYEHYSLVE